MGWFCKKSSEDDGYKIKYISPRVFTHSSYVYFAFGKKGSEYKSWVAYNSKDKYTLDDSVEPNIPLYVDTITRIEIMPSGRVIVLFNDAVLNRQCSFELEKTSNGNICASMSGGIFFGDKPKRPFQRQGDPEFDKLAILFDDPVAADAIKVVSS